MLWGPMDQIFFNYRPPRKLWEGNDFTSVCLFTGGWFARIPGPLQSGGYTRYTPCEVHTPTPLEGTRMINPRSLLPSIIFCNLISNIL